MRKVRIGLPASLAQVDAHRRRPQADADDPQAAAPLEIAASISSEEGTACSAEVLTSDQLSNVAWDQTSLVLWQSPLPSGATADLLQSFVDNGGQIVFFPPHEPTNVELFGQQWEAWSDEPAPVETWRGDADLLARTQSGAALPVGGEVVLAEPMAGTSGAEPMGDAYFGDRKSTRLNSSHRT